MSENGSKLLLLLLVTTATCEGFVLLQVHWCLMRVSLQSSDCGSKWAAGDYNDFDTPDLHSSPQPVGWFTVSTAFDPSPFYTWRN